jgi:hypothetical protein
MAECDVRYLIEFSRLQHLLEIEKQWKAHNSRQSGAGDGGDAEEQVEDDRQANLDHIKFKQDSELRTPVAEYLDAADTTVEENRYTRFINLVKKEYQTRAGKLLAELDHHPQVVHWDEDGNLFFHNEAFKGANLKQLLPLTFYGSRQKFVTGQLEFFKALNDLGLSKFVRNRSKLRLSAAPKQKGKGEGEWFRI